MTKDQDAAPGTWFIATGFKLYILFKCIIPILLKALELSFFVASKRLLFVIILFKDELSIIFVKVFESMQNEEPL